MHILAGSTVSANNRQYWALILDMLIGKNAILTSEYRKVNMHHSARRRALIDRRKRINWFSLVKQQQEQQEQQHQQQHQQLGRWESRWENETTLTTEKHKRIGFISCELSARLLMAWRWSSIIYIRAFDFRITSGASWWQMIKAMDRTALNNTWTPFSMMWLMVPTDEHFAGREHDSRWLQQQQFRALIGYCDATGSINAASIVIIIITSSSSNSSSSSSSSSSTDKRFELIGEYDNQVSL